MALVLCTGNDYALLATRKLILEQAGHTVVSVSSTQAVIEACDRQQFQVAVVGQSISPSEKRRAALLIRQYCPAIRLLELYTAGAPRAIPDADAWLFTPADVPSDLARLVSELADQSDQGAAS